MFLPIPTLPGLWDTAKERKNYCWQQTKRGVGGIHKQPRIMLCWLLFFLPTNIFVALLRIKGKRPDPMYYVDIIKGTIFLV